MSNWQLISLIINFFLLNLIICEDVYDIKDFRGNSIINQVREEGIYHVNLGIPNNTRILSYVDFNSDK